MIPGGTDSTTGAKLRMLVTPALTSRSAASWAAEPGVATTPIDTFWARTIAGRSSSWRTRTPPMTLPILAASTSTMPATGKPRCAEAAVAGEGLAEVAGADDDDGPVVGEPELAAHLVDEVLDLVADARGCRRCRGG